MYLIILLVLLCMKTKTNQLIARLQRPQSTTALVAFTKITANVTARRRKSPSRSLLQFIMHPVEGDVT